MQEFIIPDLTKEEVNILEKSDIDWYPDDILSDKRDVVVHGTEEDVNGVLKLIGRR